MKRKTVKDRKKKRFQKTEGGKTSKYAKKKDLQNEGIYSNNSPFKVKTS